MIQAHSPFADPGAAADSVAAADLMGIAGAGAVLSAGLLSTGLLAPGNIVPSPMC